ncbi:MAG: thioredoxin family protein [Patescibacteria group bacterium]
MIKIVEVTSPGCTHCAAAKKIFEGEIRPQFPDVDIQYIDVLTPEGQKLVGEYGIMSSPGIIVNGELFAVGGLDKNKLIAKIKELKG